MNIKARVALLALLHIIPLELKYGHYTKDLILSRLIGPSFIRLLSEFPDTDFAILLYKEALIILFSLIVPKSTYIYKVLFNTHQSDSIPFFQEKGKPKPATHWLSSLLDILISLNILYSLILLGTIYTLIGLVYFIQVPNGLANPFFSTLIYQGLLLTYAILVIVAKCRSSDQYSYFIVFLASFYSYSCIIMGVLTEVKNIFLPTA
ncbi:hypothetical protein BDF21DRAFT_419271 [Thamnidium elegans]|nr:hypothetical protein BDF21DRAFT_419271 [Thamnidium elegans]